MTYRLIQATANHGVYIEDECGTTVCDFYFMDNQNKRPRALPYVQFLHAQANAKLIVDILNKGEHGD